VALEARGLGAVSINVGQPAALVANRGGGASIGVAYAGIVWRLLKSGRRHVTDAMPGSYRGGARAGVSFSLLERRGRRRQSGTRRFGQTGPPQLLIAALAAERVWKVAGHDFTITPCVGGKHMAASFHYGIVPKRRRHSHYSPRG
jgi:hypothetical protein